jgi:uncharacterized protein YuzE
MIRINYDPETDILKIVLSDKTVFESDEEKPGVILDYDQDGAIIGLELLARIFHRNVRVGSI